VGHIKRPRDWPANLKWKRFRADWVTMLIFVELFLLDMVLDPLTQAMHYGSIIDTPPPGAKLIKTTYRNMFYKGHTKK